MSRPSDVGLGVALVVFNEKFEILMQHRQGAHASDTWSLPGGWMDRADSFIEVACQRETKEEFGIDVFASNMTLLGVSTEDFKDFRTVTVYYWTQSFVGIPKIMEPEKASEWAWVDCNNPPQSLFPGLYQVWKKIRTIAVELEMESLHKRFKP